jgi:hypothetical protein
MTDVSVVPAAAAEREGPRKRAPSPGAAHASVSAALTSEPSADAAQAGSKRQRFATAGAGHASADFERELESGHGHGHGQPALDHLGQLHMQRAEEAVETTTNLAAAAPPSSGESSLEDPGAAHEPDDEHVCAACDLDFSASAELQEHNVRRHPQVRSGVIIPPPQPPRLPPAAPSHSRTVAQNCPGYGWPLERQPPFTHAEVACMLLRWDSYDASSAIIASYKVHRLPHARTGTHRRALKI